MKVRIGRQQFAVATSQQSINTAKIEEAVEDAILRKVVEEVGEASERFVPRLRKRLQLVATAEAAKIFSTIADIIDQPRHSSSDEALRYTDLMRGVQLAQGFSAQGGSIAWPALSLRYAVWKSKHRPANRYNMFRLNNYLRNFFRNSSSRLVTSKLGGIEVSVVRADLHKPKVDPRHADLSHLELDRLTVSIFPRLAPGLAPMMSTRRWTDVNQNGDMERTLFRGTRTATKLVNGARPYRPLVAPTIQFFTLVRIPNVIRRSLATSIGRLGSLEE